MKGIQLPVEIYCSRVTQKQILINVCCEILNDNSCLLLEGLAVRCLAPPLAREGTELQVNPSGSQSDLSSISNGV